MRWVLGLAVGLALCAGLSACGGPNEPKGPGYTPIPNKELFAQVEKVRGVSKVDIEYQDSFGNSNDYVGDIYISSAANAAAILDRALAVLRQGRWRASMTVVAVQDDHQISTDVLGLRSPTNRFLTERYGPQPGNGKPPKTTQVPTP